MGEAVADDDGVGVAESDDGGPPVVWVEDVKEADDALLKLG